MPVRIYKPSRTAMQSGLAKTRRWVVEHEQAEARSVEPLMGWTSSGDTRQQLRLFFATKEEAIAYCVREGLAHRVEDATKRTTRTAAYADNFRSGAPEPWTH